MAAQTREERTRLRKVAGIRTEGFESFQARSQMGVSLPTTTESEN